jgi:hypothetical protein
MPLFRRIRASTADGLALIRSKRAHHCRNAWSATFDGAKASRLAPVPHDVSTRLRNASKASGGST